MNSEGKRQKDSIESLLEDTSRDDIYQVRARLRRRGARGA